MFSKVKQLFSKRKKRAKYNTTQSVKFRDMAGKEIVLEIRVNGNDTLLSIHDPDKTVEFLFDQEAAVLFDALVQYYAAHNVFPDLTDEE
ncbi:MAG: hypothetical protein J5691_01130 [Bacilli bacterium]|nr:hypothetical protein [Bacilli bacterium]